MAEKITNTQYYSDIADAIRSKNSSSDSYLPSEMPQAILDLSFNKVWVVPNGLKMFHNNMENPDLSNWDTSHLTNVYQMFYANGKLTTLDLSSWDLSNVTNASYFTTHRSGNYPYITYLDISNWDLTNLTSYNAMFGGVSTSAEIIVKDQASKDWMTANFPSYSNVHIKGE